MRKGKNTENLFSHGNARLRLQEQLTQQPKNDSHFVIWQITWPHSMPGSFPLILIPNSKRHYLKNKTKAQMFTDWQRFSNLGALFKFFYKYFLEKVNITIFFAVRLQLNLEWSRSFHSCYFPSWSNSLRMHL